MLLSTSLKSMVLLFAMGTGVKAMCPYMAKRGQVLDVKMTENAHAEEGRHLMQRSLAVNARTNDAGIPEGGFKAVRDDLRALMTDSQDFFPADFDPPVGPHYGGLMIRLAWHCSGSYRESDGRGGCDGGRIRFDPEINWPDNANLNMALKLLEPIKEKYGSTLSWGDLIILAGNTAIESMGGPVLGFCGGRVDDLDGNNSLVLGPSDAQEELMPCQSIGLQGQCPSPLGPTTMGLIYVNPEGPVTAPGDPLASGLDVRNAFSRMGFNDTETVALIGGGHTFGKCHGACTNPPCGEEPLLGIGPNTYTSGFEGAWTTRPTTWSTDYFTNLLNLDWEVDTGPGGFLQWAPSSLETPIIMLTTDVAMKEDPDYLPLSEQFARNITFLEEQFAAAWYRLTTADMGPHERCLNDDLADIPPPQWWQYPLPTDESDSVDYVPIRSMIQDLIDQDSSNIPAFSNLALRCASTFRATDYKGGCNGARVRFAPESEWPENVGTGEALAALEPVKEAFPGISYADLIVLAGQTAIEAAGGKKMTFCGGRVDATDGSGSEALAPRYYDPPVVSIRDDMQVKGLTNYEGVALFARPKGSQDAISNQYFVRLLEGTGDFDQYEKALLEVEFLPVVQEFSDNETKFMESFSVAWTKMMSADRFDGPDGNVCAVRGDPTLSGEEVTGGGSGESDGTGSSESGTSSTEESRSNSYFAFQGRNWASLLLVLVAGLCL